MAAIVPSVVRSNASVDVRELTPSQTDSSRRATSLKSSLNISLFALGILRTLARQGSAVDAVVVASAEPGGSVLSGDISDLRAIAADADDVLVIRI